MSDAATRALERRWRETRDPTDLRAWLRARQQAGGFDDHLRLAAHLGSSLARELLGRPAKPIASMWEWWDTARRLVRNTGSQSAAARAQFVLTGKPAPAAAGGLDLADFELRACLALARALVPLAEPAREALAVAVDALAARVHDPQADPVSRARAIHFPRAAFAPFLSPELESQLDPQEGEGAYPLGVEFMAADLDRLTHRVAYGVLMVADPAEWRPARPFLAFLAARACCLIDQRADAVTVGGWVLGPEETVAAIGAGVVPWVLGCEA